MSRQLHNIKKTPTPAEVPNEEEKVKPITAEVGRIIVAHLIYSADDTETERFRLASGNETDRRPEDSVARRSVQSPLGKSVLKREAGENSFFITPEGTVVGVEIRSIEPPEDT